MDCSEFDLPDRKQIAEIYRFDPLNAKKDLRSAFESLEDPADCPAALDRLRSIFEAYGGLSAVAARAGVNRSTLHRSLGSSGNPTLKTLVSVLNSIGLRLSIAGSLAPAAKPGTPCTPILSEELEECLFQIFLSARRQVLKP